MATSMEWIGGQNRASPPITSIETVPVDFGAVHVKTLEDFRSDPPILVGLGAMKAAKPFDRLEYIPLPCPGAPGAVQSRRND